ncbi:MAG: hypothetical protein ACJAR2_000988 [Ilumatobacter sp.]|jgi:hypothetical protein
MNSASLSGKVRILMMSHSHDIGEMSCLHDFTAMSCIRYISNVIPGSVIGHARSSAQAA